MPCGLQPGAERSRSPSAPSCRLVRSVVTFGLNQCTRLADERAVAGARVELAGPPAVPRHDRPVGPVRIAERLELAWAVGIDVPGERVAPRTPRSPVGQTSRRRSWNSRNISAVHRPMPRTVVSRATTSSSLSRARRRGVSTTVPSSTLPARSRTDSALLPDSPAARSVLGREGEQGPGVTPRRGRRPGGRGWRGGRAGELLVHDGSDQGGEMGSQPGPRPRPDRSTRRAMDGVAAGELASRGGVRGPARSGPEAALRGTSHHQGRSTAWSVRPVSSSESRPAMSASDKVKSKICEFSSMRSRCVDFGMTGTSRCTHQRSST